MELKDIGNTPLVELATLCANGNRVFSKCEYLNPSGSHKDRTYLISSIGWRKLGPLGRA